MGPRRNVAAGSVFAAGAGVCLLANCCPFFSGIVTTHTYHRGGREKSIFVKRTCISPHVQFSQTDCLSGRLIREGGGAREPSKGRTRKKFQSLSLSRSPTATNINRRSFSLKISSCVYAMRLHSGRPKPRPKREEKHDTTKSTQSVKPLFQPTQKMKRSRVAIPPQFRGENLRKEQHFFIDSPLISPWQPFQFLNGRFAPLRFSTFVVSGGWKKKKREEKRAAGLYFLCRRSLILTLNLLLFSC